MISTHERHGDPDGATCHAEGPDGARCARTLGHTGPHDGPLGAGSIGWYGPGPADEPAPLVMPTDTATMTVKIRVDDREVREMLGQAATIIEQQRQRAATAEAERDGALDTLRDVLVDHDIDCVPHVGNEGCPCSAARAHRLVDAHTAARAAELTAGV